jgi:hypothetical protein
MSAAVVQLSTDEARTLAAYGRRQLAWDPHLAVRLVTTDNALGLYTAPPMRVLALFAVPAVVEGSQGIDRTVLLASLVAALDRCASNAEPLDTTALGEVQLVGSVGVAMLPPTDGWQVPMYAVAGDLCVKVDEAVREFNLRSKGQPQILVQQVAEEIWSRQSWGALPLRALHAARRLGMINPDASRVSCSSHGLWKRLATNRGQIFVRSSDQQASFRSGR